MLQERHRDFLLKLKLRDEDVHSKREETESMEMREIMPSLGNERYLLFEGFT